VFTLLRKKEKNQIHWEYRNIPLGVTMYNSKGQERALPRVVMFVACSISVPVVLASFRSQKERMRGCPTQVRR
jgi:hypothetical protein